MIFRLLLIATIMNFGIGTRAQAQVIQPTRSDVAAFVDAYPSGPINQPVFVTSLAEFEKIFGSLSSVPGADNRAYLQIKQFFRNGGTKAWINRIVPPNWVGNEKERTGIHALTDSFNILVLPGIATLKEADARVARQDALEFVNERNAFLILDPPSGVDFDSLIKWRDNDAPELRQQKNAAIYFPRIQVEDPASGKNGRFLEASGSMAGIMASVAFGSDVWNSPANVSIVGAKALEFRMDDADQGKLNVPLNGVAVNAIRIFPNYGILVWGARTCDGNSDDSRYISVRRTMQMLERDISSMLMPYVFSPNDETTWRAVQSDVNSYLSNLWSMGALVGATAPTAFSVQIGLGTTMTSQDILNGQMLLSVLVALVHPAEFQVMTFSQQVQGP